MMEELWYASNTAKASITLEKETTSEYRIIIRRNDGVEMCVYLDRKHLKDLFNSLGNELNAF